jgi:hypothetical protein
MNHSIVSNVINVITNALVAYSLFTYFTAARRFPDKDPRHSLYHLPLSQQIPPVLGLVAGFAILSWLAMTFDMVGIYKFFSGVLLVFGLAFLFFYPKHLDKRYGSFHPTSVSSPKVVKLQLIYIFIGFVATLFIFSQLTVFFNLPIFYLYFAILLLAIILFGLLRSFRRSQIKKD